jgi:hypothetical protein
MSKNTMIGLGIAGLAVFLYFRNKKEGVISVGEGVIPKGGMSSCNGCSNASGEDEKAPFWVDSKGW